MRNEKNRFEFELKMNYRKLKLDSKDDTTGTNVLDNKLSSDVEYLPKEKEVEIRDVLQNLLEDDSSEITAGMIGNLSDFFE